MKSSVDRMFSGIENGSAIHTGSGLDLCSTLLLPRTAGAAARPASTRVMLRSLRAAAR
jgi:hypothetical protein